MAASLLKVKGLLKVVALGDKTLVHHVASVGSSRQQEGVFFHVQISSTLFFTGGFVLALPPQLGAFRNTEKSLLWRSFIPCCGQTC